MASARRRFVLPAGLRLEKWFPAHMYSGIKQMQAKVRSVDCFLEIHDARLPLTGRNSQFSQLLSQGRPHLLLLNKVDLVERKRLDQAVSRLRATVTASDVLQGSFKGPHKWRTAKSVLSAILRTFDTAYRFHREGLVEYNVMLVGIPNVGKSTAINCLRQCFTHMNPSACSVGAQPGVTRALTGRVKVCSEPKVYIYDTPGLLTPDLYVGRQFRPEVVLKLGLCQCLPDQRIGVELLASYLLFIYNNTGRADAYVRQLKLDSPLENVSLLLNHIAEMLNLKRSFCLYGQTTVVPDLEEAAKRFLEMFRQGKFGDQFLDADALEQR